MISHQGGRSPHKRKAPIQVRDIEEIDSDEESNDVEEVQDDDDVEDEEDVDDSDSDIMEVEAEDPLSGGGAAGMEKKSAPNVVTIDDVKTLQRLANNAKKQVRMRKYCLFKVGRKTVFVITVESQIQITRLFH